MPITDFFIKDVRCFAGENNFRIRPLTFLVGENSTGKSTVLACMQAMGDFVSSGGGFNFNKPPYNMGTFREIVRKSNPANHHYELGFTYTARDSKYGKCDLVMGFKKKDMGTEPVVSYQEVDFGKVKVVLKGTKNREQTYGRFSDISKKTGGKKTIFTLKVDEHILNTCDVLDLLELSSRVAFSGAGYKVKDNGKTKLFDELKGAIKFDSFSDTSGIEWMTRSTPPIRSAPQRTYDPIAEPVNPAGSEILTMLMNLFLSRKSDWEKLRKELINYGKDAGLFTSIDIRPLTKSGSDPFQIKIKTTGSGVVNLIDVGCGVNQALPVIINILRNPGGTLLIQQPEIHLHPRGQAALTSLLIQQLKGSRREKCFVIETHSDYMIDRMRIEIRRGKIAPDDVSLIYFEEGRKGASAYNITFDEIGEMHGVPDGFRQFFVRETHSFLGFDD